MTVATDKKIEPSDAILMGLAKETTSGSTNEAFERLVNSLLQRRDGLDPEIKVLLDRPVDAAGVMGNTLARVVGPVAFLLEKHGILPSEFAEGLRRFGPAEIPNPAELSLLKRFAELLVLATPTTKN